MQRVDAPHGTRAAPAEDVFDGAEGRQLAVHRHRDVEGPGVRVVRHRPPALEPRRARAHVDLDPDLGDHPRPVGHFARLAVDVDDVLIADIVRAEELTRLPVELPEDAELAHLEELLPAVHIDEERLEHLVHVVGFAGQVLVVPEQLAGIGVERQARVRVQRVAVGAAYRAGPRLGLGGGPVDDVQLRVVAAGDPGVAAGPEAQGQIAPGVPARVFGARDRRGAPDLFAGRRIVAGDEADVVLVAAAAGDAGDQLAVGDDRAGGVAVAEGRVGGPGLPDQFPVARVERQDRCPAGGGEDAVAEDRDVLLHPAAESPRAIAGDLRPVLPDQVAVGGVERLDHAAGMRQVHDPVVDQRRRLLGAGVVHRPRPHQLELADVLGRDLVERAVAPGVLRPSPVEPLSRFRVAQHLLRDRLETGFLGRDAGRCEQHRGKTVQAPHSEGANATSRPEAVLELTAGGGGRAPAPR